MKYRQLLNSILRVQDRALTGAALAVNQFLVLRNWIIGEQVVEYEQHGEDRAAYGERLLPRLSRDLAAKGLKGCSPDMLERMRQLYQEYPQLQTCISAPVVRKFLQPLTTGRVAISAPQVRKSTLTPLPADEVLRFSWTHLIELLNIGDRWKRGFCENECLRGNWSKRHLQRQIGSLLYERTGLATDKRRAIERGRRQAVAAPPAITELIRDPYVLEFTGLADREEYHESDLEQALLDHLQSFLLELGTGFCFEARQFRVTVGNDHDYLDLVFYHRVLRCHLLLDLKLRAFRHADAGQMNYYLNYFKDRVLQTGDTPPVGILLCSDKDETKVEFATAGMDNQLFASRYLVALPKPEQLKGLVEADRARFESANLKARTAKRGSRPAPKTGTRK